MVSALKARTGFGKLLRRVEDERRSLLIEERGTPEAVLLSIRDYVGLAAPLLPSTPHCSPAGNSKLARGLRQQLLQLIKSRCYRVAPTKRLQVTPDPDDDIFLDWRR